MEREQTTVAADPRPGPWRVYYEPVPFPGMDWAFEHEDYDGAPDSGDRRCGRADSEAGCRRAIAALEEDAAAVA